MPMQAQKPPAHCTCIRILLLWVALLLGGCASTPQTGSAPGTAEAVQVELAGRPVRSFHYQLQDIDLNELAASPYDLLIIDYSRDGSAQEMFSKQEISDLQNSGDGKLVLAYLSIGEAEDYRSYWKETIHEYLDTILAAGYDGVYLDTIESYQSFEDVPDAERKMADFVIYLAAYARTLQPSFLIVPQNGINLALDYEDYRHTVDALGQEDIFYGYPQENRLSEAAFLDEVLPKVDTLTAQGLPVLAIAYTTRDGQIRDNVQRCREHGLLCFATTRDLNRLISQPNY